jgi:hypothetical protein
MQNQPTMPSFLGLSDLNQKIWGGGDSGPCTLQVLYLIFFFKKTLFLSMFLHHTTANEKGKSRNLEG